MPLEDTESIDIGLRTKDGGVELVITDSGVTSDQEQRLTLLRKKIERYAAYINSAEFEKDFPGIGRDCVAIRVMCANAPSEAMAKIRAISIKTNPPVIVPVVYQRFELPT